MPGVFLLLAGRFPTTSLLLCRLGNASGIHAQCLILFRSRALAGPRRCQITWPMDSETWSTAASSCRQINDQLPHSCCTASGPKALVHPCLVVKDGGTCCWYWFTLLRDSRDTKIGIDALSNSLGTLHSYIPSLKGWRDLLLITLRHHHRLTWSPSIFPFQIYFYICFESYFILLPIEIKKNWSIPDCNLRTAWCNFIIWTY